MGIPAAETFLQHKQLRMPCPSGSDCMTGPSPHELLPMAVRAETLVEESLQHGQGMSRKAWQPWCSCPTAKII